MLTLPYALRLSLRLKAERSRLMENANTNQRSANLAKANDHDTMFMSLCSAIIDTIIILCLQKVPGRRHRRRRRHCCCSRRVVVVVVVVEVVVEVVAGVVVAVVSYVGVG